MISKNRNRQLNPEVRNQWRDRTRNLGLERHKALSFEGLANEIIQEIIRYVPHPQTSLSLCSKRLHDLTQPFLYANVSLLHKTSYPSFIRTVSHRPDLTRHVRHFQTFAYTSDWDFDFKFLKDKHWVRRSLPSIFGDEACNHWFETIFAFTPDNRILMAAVWDAATAFILCLFSAGLQSIYMEPYGSLFAKYSYIDMVLEQASRGQSRIESIGPILLPNLRSVSIVGPHQPLGLTFKFVLPFLEVKSVKSVQLSKLRNDASAAFQIPPVLETTDLTVLNSYLSSNSIRQILPLFKSLKRFQYQYGATDRHHRLPPRPSIIKESLLNSKNTLEEFSITVERHTPHLFWAAVSGGSIGSFADFNRLRYDFFFPLVLNPLPCEARLKGTG
jgi:hypothetical protein